MSTECVILFDAMDTLVQDPFFTAYPQFFGMPLRALLREKNSDAWPEFERGQLTESEYAGKAFSDGRAYDYDGLKKAIYDGYQLIEGMEDILKELCSLNVEMHMMSNYPVWYRMLDQKLELSRYLPWTFVSCSTGFRKPDQNTYQHAIQYLGRAPQELVLIDDRQENINGAEQAGLQGILFEGADSLRVSLRALGVRLEPPPSKSKSN
jgi:FMN hydrolase / 5-amino-6-(5-phospho-D-ribitylamino)uracil phosphatase